MTPDEIREAYKQGEQGFPTLNAWMAEAFEQQPTTDRRMAFDDFIHAMSKVFPSVGGMWRWSITNLQWEPCPFCTSHDAVHEAEERLSEEQQMRYVHELFMLGTEASTGTLRDFWHIRHASAAQCVVAMLMGVAEETQGADA